MTEGTKTKKIKKNQANNDLWKKFDEEINNNKSNLECIYSNQNGQRELCECCGSILIITDEGFMSCKNLTCGVLYKDMIDHSAESTNESRGKYFCKLNNDLPSEIH